MYHDLLIPQEIAKRSDLGATHKLVLGEMIRRQSGGTHFVASYEQLAVGIGANRRTVIRVMADLIAKSEVRRTRQGREEAHAYSVRFANNRNRQRKIAAAALTAGALSISG